MNIKRLIYSRYSNVIISIILGLGLAALFKPYLDKSPSYDDIVNNTWQDGDYCYTLEVDKQNGDSYKKCDESKNIIELNA